MAKFVLLENFSWLIDNLKSFVDPQFTYDSVGEPSLKGGQRRIERKNRHFPTEYDPNEIHVTAKIKKTVNFYGEPIECDEWTVAHNTFKDDKLKEKYPQANHSVVITSTDSLRKGTAKRYYVSCTCRDFETTFKEKLLDTGYTLGSVQMSSGKKLLAPAICKHIYGVLVKYYGDIISAESAPTESAEIGNAATSTIDQQQTTDAEPLDFVYADDLATLDTTVPDNNPVQYEKELDKLQTTRKKVSKKRPKESPKEELKRYIQKTLRYIDLRIPNKLEYYRNPRGQVQGAQSNNYKYYKFMLKRYPKGWVIVFTNPLMGSENQYLGLAGGELVPVMNWGSKKRPYLSGVSNIYQQFTKEELLNMIRSSKRLTVNTQQKLNKAGQRITESLEIDETPLKQILLGII